ncbi:MAG: hypothetical protein STSR0004_01460 [Peptococcaceae bacterium]
MKKTIFLLTLLFCLLLGATTAFAQDSTNVGISPATTTVNQGQTFTVDISVTPAVAIAGMQFDLSFNPAIVEAVSVTEGNLLKQGGNSTYFQSGTIDNATGKITGVAGAITTPGGEVAGAGIFATVTLKAKDNGNTDLILDKVIVGNKAGQAVPVSITQGTVTVEAAAPVEDKVTVALEVPQEVLKGKSFALKVTITEVTYLDACSYDLVYNSSVLELEKVTGGEIDGNPFPIAHYKNEIWSGKVTVVQNIYGVEGVSGSGYLGELHFKALQASNKTGLKFQNGVLSDKDAQAIPANWLGTTLKIKDTGGPDGLKGDHNKDGRLDAQDITLIELIVLGRHPVTDTADVNGDGAVDARDITATELLVLNA